MINHTALHGTVSHSVPFFNSGCPFYCRQQSHRLTAVHESLALVSPDSIFYR